MNYWLTCGIGVYCVLQSMTDSCVSDLSPPLLGLYRVRTFQMPEVPQMFLFMHDTKFDNFIVGGCTLWVCTVTGGGSPLSAGNITWPHYISLSTSRYFHDSQWERCCGNWQVRPLEVLRTVLNMHWVFKTQLDKHWWERFYVKHLLIGRASDGGDKVHSTQMDRQYIDVFLTHKLSLQRWG